MSSPAKMRMVTFVTNAVLLKLGGAGFSKVLASKGDKRVYQVSTDTHTQITDLACSSAAGEMLSPLIIFPGQRFGYNPLEGFKKARFAKSNNGWIDGEIFTSWLETAFIPDVDHLPKPVLLFADGHKTHLTLTVNTGKTNPVTHEPIIKLAAVPDFNKFMGAVDRSNQMVSYNAFKRKWWKKAFFHMFMLAVLNSYILHKCTVPSAQAISHRIFRRDLAMQMVAWAPLSIGRTLRVHRGNSCAKTHCPSFPNS
ncbi:PiggyBac transposable element-derived protein 4-like [Elysia marginata]|uniref:PiggyBac transposable element-derived protein 4-like n=1 Tax=Elysia marginata TaxID=1093978 RepID=A0AAV4IH42_9GAST|nr:PiggyBac transposable element-derived protein 4-like [Elysia marginata]